MALSWKHVVPWRTRSEFVQTYLDLYSKNVERQRTAVETISLWKCRVTNKLSVAIENSATLTEAYLQYQVALDAGDVRSKDFILRTLMTMALIRFVNHITEKGQNKPFAQPVHKIAQDCGIPQWIVQVRHDGTHGSMPCLEVLNKAVQWALTYLQDVFWSQQVKEADECSDPNIRKRKRSAKSLYNMAEIYELLQNYQKASRKSIEDGPESEAAREEKRCLRRIEHTLNSQHRNNVLCCLVEPGHLLPTEQQLHSYHVNLEDTLFADPPRVPVGMINVWKELFRMMQSKQLTSLLLQHMIKKVVNEEDPTSQHSMMLVAWLRLVLLYHTSNFAKTADERVPQPELFSNAIEFPKHLLLSTCVQFPNVWTCSLLRFVGHTDSVSQDIYGKLDELKKVFKGDGSTPADKNNSDEDMPADKTIKLTNATAVEKENCWKLCTDPVDWEKLPMGLLPSQASSSNAVSMEHREHSHSSSSDEEEGRSSEDEAETTTLKPPDIQETRVKSPENLVKGDPPSIDAH